ncbi:hypothetical protein FB45DRAFT_741758 [Roridomyces roridus]|uniref:Uncharacterized protein n=1 Tax=Roridomyces roridus TaxID=1738132 RepID=A0AAD7C0W9_9AGAR|nr:hypothetical protein FB45DRAFT_741758 [Roridomyces roridus]
MDTVSHIFIRHEEPDRIKSRFNSEEIFGNSALLMWSIEPDFGDMWMSQANHTFKRLGIISAHDAYGRYLVLHFSQLTEFTVLIDSLATYAHMMRPASNKENSGGYLFLCPSNDLLSSSNSPQWPECPYFWSFDPSGQDRLNAEEATSHGFPAVEMSMTFWGKSWDTKVYQALRTLHAFKGFDPDSQELAIHLGQPLFQLSGEAEESFGHGASQPSSESASGSNLPWWRSLRGTSSRPR